MSGKALFHTHVFLTVCVCVCARRSVRNSLTGGHSALKKIPNVFSSLLSAIRTFREVKMLCELSHDNVSGRAELVVGLKEGGNGWERLLVLFPVHADGVGLALCADGSVNNESASNPSCGLFELADAFSCD